MAGYLVQVGLPIAGLLLSLFLAHQFLSSPTSKSSLTHQCLVNEFLPRLVKFDRTHPDYSLRIPVSQFDQHPRPINEIPCDFLEYFPLPAMATSLNLKLPPLPEAPKFKKHFQL
jgi:hypothetical protein